jgi:carbonic anhydrase/acetyltransferase-like protein (isoleucine patch superfamily)
MLITHLGKSPQVHASTYVAPNAVVCGDVTVGPGCRITFGAQIIAEGGSIAIGRESIVMENAALRANARHPLRSGNNYLIGRNAHVVGCSIEDQIFVATGAAIFHGAHVGKAASCG